MANERIITIRRVHGIHDRGSWRDSAAEKQQQKVKRFMFSFSFSHSVNDAAL